MATTNKHKGKKLKRDIQKHDVQTSDNFESQAFTVNLSSEMFELMSAGVYSRPEEAIIRELACNSADSHIAAGVDKKVIVKLPTMLDNEFYVQDFGTGLTPTEIRDVYTVMFKSDKTHTNDVTGCFGIGSKSPFAYTAQFSVESVVDGTKWIYSCFLDESRLPRVADMTNGGFPTDEPNGVKVSFPVLEQDQYKFHKAVVPALQHFDNIPDVQGLRHAVKAPQKVTEGDGWYVAHGAYPIVATMGNVGYQVDTSKLPRDLGSYESLFLNYGQTLHLQFEIGDVLPAASREHLRYDEKTIAAIQARVEQYLAEVAEFYQAELDAQPNLYKAACWIRKNTYTARKLNILIGDVFSWDGKDRTYVLEGDALQDVWVFKNGFKYNTSYGSGKRSTIPRNLPLDADVVLVGTDKSTRKVIRTKYLSEQNPDTYYVLPVGACSKEECEAFAKACGFPDTQIVWNSEIVVPKAARKVTTRKANIRKFRGKTWSSRQCENWGPQMALSNESTPEFAYYVVTDRDRFVDSDGESKAPDVLARRINSLGKDIEVEVYGVTKSNVKDLPESWRPLLPELEEFKAWLDGALDMAALQEAREIARKNVYARLFDSSLPFDDPRVEKIVNFVKNNENQHLTIDFYVKPSNIVTDDWEALMSDYPLLRTIAFYSDMHVEHAVIYMNAVYNQNN